MYSLLKINKNDEALIKSAKDSHNLEFDDALNHPEKLPNTDAVVVENEFWYF